MVYAWGAAICGPTSRCSRRGPAAARRPLHLVTAKPRRAATSACGTGRATERQCVGRTAIITNRRNDVGSGACSQEFNREATALLETLTLSVGRRTLKRSCYIALRVGDIRRSYVWLEGACAGANRELAASGIVMSSLEVLCSESEAESLVQRENESGPVAPPNKPLQLARPGFGPPPTPPPRVASVAWSRGCMPRYARRSRYAFGARDRPRN